MSVSARQDAHTGLLQSFPLHTILGYQSRGSSRVRVSLNLWCSVTNNWLIGLAAVSWLTTHHWGGGGVPMSLSHDALGNPGCNETERQRKASPPPPPPQALQ